MSIIVGTHGSCVRLVLCRDTACRVLSVTRPKNDMKIVNLCHLSSDFCAAKERILL